jgi:hypothetical protein
MERELKKQLSACPDHFGVADLAKAAEKLALRRIADLRVDTRAVPIE